MAVFAVTFRLESDSGYSDRYQSLMDKIKKEASSATWDEPTSFVLMESSKTAQGLCDALYYGSTISESKDQLLVVSLSSKEYAERGCKYKFTLQQLMNAR
jgi:hypothetical protein